MAMAERKQFPSEKQDQYMLRLPDGMRDRLKEEAAKSKRSLNAEIIARLEDTLKEEPPGDLMAKTFYPLLVDLFEQYQRGEKPKLPYKRKKP